MSAAMDERDEAELQVSAAEEVSPAEGLSPTEDVETVEGVLVTELLPLHPVPTVLPAVQAAAVAATSFVAGAATLALLHRHSARKLARSQRSAPRRAVDMLPIVGSRTFLVDVHLIAKPSE